MNEQDKRAFAEAAKGWATKSAGKDLGEYFWQAALEYARQQEPVAWAEEIIDDLQSQFDTDGITHEDSGAALIYLSQAISAIEDIAKRHSSQSAKQSGEQEPVAFYYRSGLIRAGYGIQIEEGAPLYTHPAQPVQPAAVINAQDRRDAARYQWLRNSGGSFDILVRQEDEEGKYWITAYSPNDFDSAIDAAIAAAEAAKGAA